MMASAQVVETLVNTNNSPSQDYTTNPDDHSNHNNNNNVIDKKHEQGLFCLYQKKFKDAIKVKLKLNASGGGGGGRGAWIGLS